MNQAEERNYLGGIVGIGASAGGLEAIQEFFDNVPPRHNVAFVVIQHLSPTYKSLMDELLARHTKMPIHRVDQEMSIEPGRVYLISPNKSLLVRNNRLIPHDLEINTGPRLPIDRFLVSLAEESSSRAVAVIMSGTGTDGTRGASAVKSNGGLVVAQAPETCKFDGMPRSVIRSGLADRVLSVKEIVPAIFRYFEQLSQASLEAEVERQPETLQNIFILLEPISGINFTNYRYTTILRRIERRMKVCHCSTLTDYLGLLENDDRELKLLHSDLLIGVTRFFRNPEGFKILEQEVLPAIFSEARQDTIRIWVAGCSTGEEAYSLAILLQEYKSQHGLVNDFKIFASDVDPEAIRYASAGVYLESAAVDLNPEHVEKYFIHRDDNIEVATALRSHIIFSIHNVVSDPPFTRLDLVSCRNLLIYFKPHLQSKVLSTFHFALKNSGFLFLGKSETLGDSQLNMRSVHPVTKIFQKIRDVRLSDLPSLRAQHPANAQMATAPRVQSASPLVRTGAHNQGRRDDVMTQIYEKIVEVFDSHSFVVDQNLDLIASFTGASKYLKLPSGRSTINAQRMLDENLALALSTAVARLNDEQGQIALTDIHNGSKDDALLDTKITVTRISVGRGVPKPFFLVQIANEGKEAKSESGILTERYDHEHFSQEQISYLEHQLGETREALQSTIEELETANEELQSTNEELMSSNEELQSTNEELQSVNEELYTVNAEYQSKIDELLQANRDIEFLLKSSSIGLMFLDRHKRIRRYNDEMSKIINILPHDIGRPIKELSFAYSNSELLDAIERAEGTGVSQSLSFQAGEQRFLVRVIHTQTDNTPRPQSDFGFIITSFNLEGPPRPTQVSTYTP